MNMPTLFTGYPVQDPHFGMLPPIAEAACKAVCAKVKEADPRMVRTHMLSILGSAVSPLYVVTPPGWKSISIGVNTLCIADVGGSKSPVHEYLIQPLKAHAKASFARVEAAQNEFSAVCAEHKFKIQMLKTQIARCGRKQEPADGLMAELATLNRSAPKPPKHRPRLASNLDLESMVRQLDGEHEAIDFITDEGDRLLDSSLMRHVSDLVDLMDGKSLEFRRENKKHLCGNQPHGTFGLMAQSRAIEPFRPRFKGRKYIEHKAVKLGFFVRMLVCNSMPVPHGNQYAPHDEDDAHLSRFQTLLQAFYDKHRDNQEAGATTPIELHFAPDAEGYWDELCRITNDLKFGQLAHIADYVSKMLYLTARLAAVLHVLESETRYISTSSLQRAWGLVRWHASQYELTFVPPPPIPQQEADVVAVMDHLTSQRFSLNYQEVPTEPVGLLLGLPNNRLRAALLRMEQRDLIELYEGRTAFINCSKMFSRSRNITWR